MHEEEPKKAIWGILARKSKVLSDSDRRREQSTDAQVAQGRRAAEREGAEVPPEYIWVELGSAYRERQRDKFDDALAALAAGMIDTLWCFDISRYSRKGADDLLRVVKRDGSGGRVIFDYEGLDSANPRDRKWIINRAEEAREYSEKLSANVRNTKRDQRDRGMWLSAPPYGLEVEPKTRKLRRGRTVARPATEERPEVLTWEVAYRIIAEAADGGRDNSLRKIAERLTDDGLPGPANVPWGISSIHRIIKHPAYQGWQIISQWRTTQYVLPYRNAAGELVPVMAAGEEPITTEELAKQARRNVSNRKDSMPNKFAGKPGTGDGHLLTGLARCYGCFGGASWTSLGYACSKHRRTPGACPEPAYLRAALVEEYVVEQWKTRVASIDMTDEADAELIMAITARWAALQNPEETEEGREALEALKAAEAALQDLVEGRYKRKEFEGPLRKLYAPMLNDAMTLVEAAKEAAAPYEKATPVAPFVGDRTLVDEAWDAADMPTRQDLLQLAIRAVVVRKHQGAQPTIHEPPKVAERTTIYWHDDPMPEGLVKALASRRGGRKRKRLA
ncbi:recombinase family protein [Streptomyces sp. NPDC001941]|uniref:recombinase family protein n=1 Tax=Streptomyces sp. NPDC001941 TaxID=3154659 RepID=UPI003329D72C